MKKRILFASRQSNNDMTAFLRTFGPFSLMRDDVEIVPAPDNFTWVSDFRYWMGIDVCFTHRPFDLYGKQIIEQCKNHKIPLWVDHDDDILAIPKTSPHYDMVEITREYGTVEMSYKEADILTCSGKLMHEELKTKYGRDDAILITTGLHDSLLQFKKRYNKNSKISWRGSYSHAQDLRSFKEQINEVVAKHQEKEWHFFGIDPRPLGINPKNLIVWPQMNIFEFYNAFTEINASVHFTVLEDNKFNRVKSNLSIMDGTLAGSVCVAPDFEENTNLFTIDFEAIDDAFPSTNQKNWEYICDVLLQSKLNEKRKEILRNV